MKQSLPIEKRLLFIRLGKTIYFIFAGIVGLLIVVSTMKYLSPNFESGFLANKKEIFGFYRYFLLLHAVGAPIALFAGIYQFSFKTSRWHQPIGKIYVAAILLLAAPGAIVMSLYAIGRTPSIISFLLLTLLWSYTTYSAWQHIRKGQVAKHALMMQRSFILTNSAILLRLFSFINHSFDLAPVQLGYIINAWACWVIPLLIFEGNRMMKGKASA